MIIINKTAMALISSPETYSERNLEIAIDVSDAVLATTNTTNEDHYTYMSLADIQPVNVRPVEHGFIRCLEGNCSFRTTRSTQLRQHLAYKHDWKIISYTYYFEDENAFEKWKQAYEEETKSMMYVLASRRTDGSKNQLYYYCTLGKKIVTVGEKRKIYNTCLSSMSVSINKKTGQVIIELVKDHYGHGECGEVVVPSVTIKNFSGQEKALINSFLAKGNSKKDLITHCSINNIPLQRRQAIVKEFGRLKFYRLYKFMECKFTVTTSKKDWFNLLSVNIEEDLFLHKKKGMDFYDQNSLLVLKSLKNIKCGLHFLSKEDFLLAHMSKRQQQTLMSSKYFIIMEVRRFAYAEQEFVSVLLFVPDYDGKILPVGYCVASGNFAEGVRCFFKAIQDYCDSVKSCYILANGDSFGPRVWREVFDQDFPVFFSPWHTAKMFSESLKSCVIDKSFSKEIKSSFENLMVSRTKSEFDHGLHGFMQCISQDKSISTLYNFFSNELMPKKGKWALCFAHGLRVRIASAGKYFSKHILKRLNFASKRRLGRCVYLINQLQKGKTLQATFDKKLPGKKMHPIIALPALDRLESLSSKGTERAAEHPAKEIQVDVSNKMVPFPPKVRQLSMQIMNEIIEKSSVLTQDARKELIIKLRDILKILDIDPSSVHAYDSLQMLSQVCEKVPREQVTAEERPAKKMRLQSLEFSPNCSVDSSACLSEPQIKSEYSYPFAIGTENSFPNSSKRKLNVSKPVTHPYRSITIKRSTSSSTSERRVNESMLVELNPQENEEIEVKPPLKLSL